MHSGKKWLYGNPVNNTTTADLISPVSLLFSLKSCPEKAIFQVFASVKQKIHSSRLHTKLDGDIQQHMVLKCKYT